MEPLKPAHTQQSQSALAPHSAHLAHPSNPSLLTDLTALSESSEISRISKNSETFKASEASRASDIAGSLSIPGISAIPDNQLIDRIRHSVEKERQATQVVLQYLLEVERRRLFLKRGFPSLFDFCIKELGYCTGSAHLRIQSMRLLKEVTPLQRAELSEKLATGKITLSQLSNLQTYSRQTAPGRVEPARKLEILSKLEGESTRDSQKIILQELGLEGTNFERMRIKGPDQIELTVTLNAEAVELLEEWKRLNSHANPEGRNGEAIVAALKIAIERGRRAKGLSPQGDDHRFKDRRCEDHQSDDDGSENHLEARRSNPAIAAAPDQFAAGDETTGQDPSCERKSSLHAHEVKSPSVRPQRKKVENHPAIGVRPGVLPQAIPLAIRKLVWARDEGQCTYVDQKTQRRCRGTFYLEIDHIRPRALGGGHQLANLRLLCAGHHRLRHSFSPWGS